MRSVVAGVLISGRRVLLVHRHPARRWYPDVWDLPGGHVEPGESEPRALVRELREELGIAVAEADLDPVTRLTGGSGESLVHLGIWRVAAWTGEVRNLSPDEHDRLGWHTADDLRALPLAATEYLPLLQPVLAEAERVPRRPDGRPERR